VAEQRECFSAAASTSNSGSSGSSGGSSGSGSSTSNTTLYNLSHLKASDFAVTIGSATANALLSDSNTKILQNPACARPMARKQR